MKNRQVIMPESFCSRYSETDGPTLKTGIYILLHGFTDTASLCAELGISEDIASRAVKYWNSVGLFDELQSDSGTGDEQKTFESKEVKAVKLEKVKHHMYQTELAVALNGNPAYASLLQESQILLGRELTTSESVSLIELSESTSVAPQLILMVESFWVSHTDKSKILRKTSYTVRDWNKEGINNWNEAERRIELMELREERYESVAKLMDCTDGFGASERKRIDEWFEKMGYDETFIQEVLLRKGDATIPYIHSVLKDWYSKGYKKVADTRVSPVNIQPHPDDGKKSDLFKNAVRRTRKDK